MSSGLPPPPTRAASGDFAWTAWYNQLYSLLNTTGSIAWSMVDKSNSSIADLQHHEHDLLTSIDGTGTNHLSASENALVTSLNTTGHDALPNIDGSGTYHLSQAEQGKVHTQPWIEVVDTSTTSMTLNTTPTLLKPPTIVSSGGIAYDPSLGEFTFTYAGSYALALHVNATASASNQFVYIFAETNTGSGWSVNANSGKLYQLVNNNTIQVVYAQAVHRTAGQKVRYRIYSNSTNVTLGTSTLPGSVGASVPAIRIQYAG